MTDLLTFLENNAAIQPDALALVFEDERWTYRQFADTVARLAGGLRAAGIKRGDRVAITAYKGNYVAGAVYALQWIGAVPVMASYSLLDDLPDVLRRTNSSAIIYGADARPMVEALDTPPLLINVEGGQGEAIQSLATSAPVAAVDRSLDDISGIIFSGGTTGRPKSILRTYGTDLWDGIQKSIIYRTGRSDVWLYISPRNLTALIGPTRPMLVCAFSYVVIDGFNAEKVARVCADERVTQLTLLAGQWSEFLDLPTISMYDLSPIRQVAAAASAVPVEIARRMKDRFGEHVGMLQVYGTSEAGMVAYDQDGKDLGPGRVGKPLPQVSVKIVNEAGETLPAGQIGEIVMRGPSQAPGYEGNPEKVPHTFQNGWVYTGDLGLLDPDGVLAVIGRMSETLRIDDKPVYPTVVQNAVTGVAGVRECAVVGLPPASPNGILVYVVARIGEDVSDEAVRTAAAAAAGLDPAQVSVRYEADLPHTPAGKVDNRTLAKMAEAG